MSTATYRGISYDTTDRKLNMLNVIKAQIEKAERQRKADMVNIRASKCSL